MIEKIEIANYRCFKSLKLSNLGRINVIVGPNSAGKTALMEAIYLVVGASPELVFRTKAFRGLPRLSLSLNKESYESLWRDLFFRFNQKERIEILLKGSPKSFARRLSIGYQHNEEIMLNIGDKDFSQADIKSVVPIVFEWVLSPKQKISATPIITSDGITVKFSEPLEPLPGGFYTSSALNTPQENAGYFSALSIKNKEKDIVNALKSEFPFVTGLSVQIFAGAPTIFASLKNMPEKIPLNLVSSGVNKLIGILLGIANQAGGVICIDELENGFYFDRLSSIWNILLEFANKFDVQIFASTHSWECLQAASDCAKKSSRKSEFTVIQSVNDNDIATFRVHSGEALVAAISQQIDVR